MRTYRGPVIQQGVENAIINGNEDRSVSPDHALAVDDGTGDITIIYVGGKRVFVSAGDPTLSRSQWSMVPFEVTNV